jgi:hypothetical protein
MEYCDAAFAMGALVGIGVALLACTIALLIYTRIFK